MLSKTIIITGGEGFISLHVVSCFWGNYFDYKIINFPHVDNLTHVKDVIVKLSSCHISKDYIIADKSKLESLKNETPIIIIHVGIECHLDRSNIDLFLFATTLVDYMEKFLYTSCISENADQYTLHFCPIFKDKVNKALNEDRIITEKTKYTLDNSSYTSITNFIHLASNYNYKYEMNCVVFYCRNDFVANHFKGKLIPLNIKNNRPRKSTPIYFYGICLRNWLGMENLGKVNNILFARVEIGKPYNLGKHNEWIYNHVLDLYCNITDKKLKNSEGIFGLHISDIANFYIGYTKDFTNPSMALYKQLRANRKSQKRIGDY